MKGKKRSSGFRMCSTLPAKVFLWGIVDFTGEGSDGKVGVFFLWILYIGFSRRCIGEDDTLKEKGGANKMELNLRKSVVDHFP